MSVGDKHGPYWALFGKKGKPSMQLIGRPGPHFLSNAEMRGDRVARVMIVEISPDAPTRAEPEPEPRPS